MANDKANKLLQENNDLIQKLGQTYKDLVTQLSDVKAKSNEFLQIVIASNKELKQATSIKAYNDAQKQLQADIKASSLAQKENIEIQKKAEQLERERIKTAQAKVRQQKAEQRETQKLNSLYKQESARLTELRNKAKDVALQFGLNSKEFRTAAKEVNTLDSRLKKIDSTLGQSQRNVGNYKSGITGLVGGFKNLAGALGVVGGFNLLAKGIKSAFDISRKYEKQNAVLASVLGKTLKQTTKLQGESQRLGSSTAFSATQVTELQTELARLGKSEEEIIASTEGIIDATLALGSETGETAALVASTLNAFQLEAKESGRVADILTLSTQRSALSFEKLNTALPIVAGAAAAAGISLEDMVAQLGKAADRGIDASTAATSLRNIYLELAKQGLTLEQALAKINNSQDKLSTANELFGKRAAVTALALADTTEQTKELSNALENAGGTAKKVAETQLNTLDGQLKLLNSAWEGLVLNINNTDTAIGKASVSMVKFATNALNQFANIGKEAELARRSIVGGFEDADDALLQYIIDTGRVEDSNGEILQVKPILDEITESWKKLDAETQSYVDLNEELARGLLKAGADAEVVDRIVKLYTQDLNLEKKAVEELNYEYDDSSDFLDEEAKNKEQLNNITKETIRLADKEIERLKRVKETPSKITDRGDELRPETPEFQGKFTAEAEANAQKLFDTWAKNQEAISRKFEGEAEHRKAIAESEAETMQMWQEWGYDTAYEIANQYFENQATLRDNNLQAEIDALQSRLDNESLDAEQREELQKQIDAKEKKLKLEKAKADRKAALIEVAIQTALGVAKTIGTIPFPAAIPFIALTIATGAVQAGLIASQPLPQYDKGTDNFPGLGEVAEKRPEFVKHKGKVELFTEPTILGSNYKGAQVISGEKSGRILDEMTRYNLISNIETTKNRNDEIMMNLAIERLIDSSNRGTEKIVNAIANSRKSQGTSIRDNYYMKKFAE
ncbi:MAG: phage tail tape measure protein [Eubacteriaceae bacterium]